MSIDFFTLAPLATFAFAAYWNFSWWLEGHRTGIATIYFNYKFDRSERPFEYRMIQLGRLAGLVVAIGMFGLFLRVWMQYK
jgi:hypothetical protein